MYDALRFPQILLKNKEFYIEPTSFRKKDKIKNQMSILLRSLQMADLTDLVRYADNPKIAENLTDQFPHPYTKENGSFFIKMAREHQPRRISAIEVDGAFAGCIGVHPAADIWHRNAELGYWLAEPFWGKGIMTEAIRQKLDYGFATFGIDRIFARPFGSNLASQRVLERNGFILEARLHHIILKNGRYEDELIYGFRTDPDKNLTND